MNAPATTISSRENAVQAMNGFAMLGFNLLLLFGSVAYFIYTLMHSDYGATAGWMLVAQIIGAVLVFVAAIFSLNGHFSLQPNEARLLILFGAYKGTVRQSGFFWANPFYAKFTKMSLRAYNLNSEKLKVNDKHGNPIEIAAVVVWRVADTAQAKFDVADYNRYVNIQSESALRHLASSYAYDVGETTDAKDDVTLRSGGDAVSAALTTELQVRLAKAGVVVDEARISYLSYAPEIAEAMLRRQQAQAVVAARQIIVHNAVSMVQMALTELSDRKVVILDDERRAAMVSNLLVVLCGESHASPVINTGTLYN
ncbi:MAG TPA: SPFH domain-containing protein [Opitutales bacterium]|nr:SPFH domain-containing protein [Opitutales bacterium]